VVGVLAALLERGTDGRGQVVRTSLLSSVIGIHSFQGTRWTVAGEVPGGSGNQHPAIAPYGLFRCADGDLQLAVGSQSLWHSLAATTGLNPTDPRYTTNSDRVLHREALAADLEAVLGQDTADVWVARFDAAGIPAGRVRTLDEVYGWAQTRQQDLVIDVEHATLGTISLPGPPWRFDDACGPARHRPPPTLGQHNASVRAWLDLREPLESEATGPASASLSAEPPKSGVTADR
jgi:crotonobetainyl-CoA:carnitine CoA-transferase CaiB-like acyl-CoA transferase